MLSITSLNFILFLKKSSNISFSALKVSYIVFIRNRFSLSAMGILTVKIVLQKFENLYAARERLEKNKKNFCVLLVRYLKIRWRVDGP